MSLANRLAADDKQSAQWLEKFTQLTQPIVQRAQNAATYAELLSIADEWKKISESLEEKYRSTLKQTGANSGDTGNGLGDDDPTAIDRRQWWYNSVDQERNLRDTVDWNLHIVPILRYEEQNMRKEHLDEEIIQKKLSNIATSEIEKLRLKKKPKEAGVVVAVFPELPFANNSFDRIVAAWSISVHSLANANEEDMKLYWREINRVLKEGGRAYIYPLSWDALDEDMVTRSVEAIPGLEASVDNSVLTIKKIGASHFANKSEGAHAAIA